MYKNTSNQKKKKSKEIQCKSLQPPLQKKYMQKSQTEPLYFAKK